jgi:hypothetical protein
MNNQERRQAVEELPELLSRLRAVVLRLEELFPSRRFTLDGHIVGSLAEVIAEYLYGLELLPGSHRCHDARCPATGVYVQIKGTQRDRVALYEEPEHLIVLRLAEDDHPAEVYNGPGAAPWAEAGPVGKNGQRTISLSRLTRLARAVPADRRIPIVRSL